MLKANSVLKETDLDSNPLTIETSRAIVKALQGNNTLCTLFLPKYPESDKKVSKILSLQEGINQKRKKLRCDVDLEINFGGITKYSYTIM